MNKIGLYILIPIVFTLEIIAILLTLTTYMMTLDGELLTKKLIDKL